MYFQYIYIIWESIVLSWKLSISKLSDDHMIINFYPIANNTRLICSAQIIISNIYLSNLYSIGERKGLDVFVSFGMKIS